MELQQQLFSGFCSTPIKTQLPSSAYFAQSQRWVSFKFCPCNSQRALPACWSSTQRDGVIVSDNQQQRRPGSNFKSIHEACIKDSILGDVVVLVTNKQGCGGAEYARDKGLAVVPFPKTKNEPDGISPVDLVAILRRLEVDFVLVAGYLQLIPVELIQAYPKSILNIHSSLLPAFGGKGNYGMRVHKAVIASGARYTGPTVHFVDEHYDTGRILAQRVDPVLANDTAEELTARVLREEHRLYVEVITALCEERIVWREDGVPIIRSKENPNEYN